MPWWKTAPEIDEEKVGITFVDVLFALVVGEILSPLRRWWTIPSLGWTHLAVALVLTLGSWIGYHMSANRPRYSIRLVNWPFAQFVLDIAMVITYWIVAVTVPVPQYLPFLGDAPPPAATALPEAILVFIAFVLYVMWDRVGHIMQNAPAFPSVVEKPYDPARRKTTVIFALVSAGIAVLAGVVDHCWGDPWSWVLTIDILLIADLVLYRTAKELVRAWIINRRPAPAQLISEEDTGASITPARPPDLMRRLDGIDSAIAEILERLGKDDGRPAGNQHPG